MINIYDFEDGWYSFEEDYVRLSSRSIIEKQSCFYIRKDYKILIYILRNKDNFIVLRHNEFVDDICPRIRKLTQDELTIKDIIE